MIAKRCAGDTVEHDESYIFLRQQKMTHFVNPYGWYEQKIYCVETVESVHMREISRLLPPHPFLCGSHKCTVPNCGIYVI